MMRGKHLKSWERWGMKSSMKNLTTPPFTTFTRTSKGWKNANFLKLLIPCQRVLSIIFIPQLQSLLRHMSNLLMMREHTTVREISFSKCIQNTKMLMMDISSVLNLENSTIPQRTSIRNFDRRSCWPPRRQTTKTLMISGRISSRNSPKLASWANLFHFSKKLLK